MHWLDGCSRIWIVGGDCSATLEGGRMGNKFEWLGEVWCPYLVYCFLCHYMGHIHAWRVLCKVHIVGIDHWDFGVWERQSCSDTIPYIGIMYLVVLYLYPADIGQYDFENANAFYYIMVMVFVHWRQTTTQRHWYYLPFLVSSSCPSKELQGGVVE